MCNSASVGSRNKLEYFKCNSLFKALLWSSHADKTQSSYHSFDCWQERAGRGDDEWLGLLCACGTCVSNPQHSGHVGRPGLEACDGCHRPWPMGHTHWPCFPHGPGYNASRKPPFRTAHVVSVRGEVWLGVISPVRWWSHE